MFCPKCGNEIADGSAYCGICGQKLDAGPPPVSIEAQADTVLDLTPPKMFCPKCGSPIFDENTACPSCGWTATLPDTNGIVGPEAQAARWTKRQLKRLLVIFGMCITVILFFTIRSAAPRDVTGDWENIYGDSVTFHEDGSCEMAIYTLESITGRPVHYASRMMYDLKFYKKMEITYVGEHGLESIQFDYDLETENGEEYLTLGTEMFMRE